MAEIGLHANTLIGEVAIHDGASGYLLRPSFFAISQLDGLDETVKAVCHALTALEHGLQPSQYDLCSCAAVLHACGLPTDRQDIAGEIVQTRRGMRWKPGKMGVHNLVVLSNALISAGLVGNKKQARKAKGPAKPFDPTEFVAVAAAHLDVPIDQAWRLTMTEFQMLMDAKHPPKKPDLTPDDVRAAMQRAGIPLH